MSTNEQHADASNSPSRILALLPAPVLAMILSHVDSVASRWKLRMVCRCWRQLIDDPYYARDVWRDCGRLHITVDVEWAGYDEDGCRLMRETHGFYHAKQMNDADDEATPNMQLAFVDAGFASARATSFFDGPLRALAPCVRALDVHGTQSEGSDYYDADPGVPDSRCAALLAHLARCNWRFARLVSRFYKRFLSFSNFFQTFTPVGAWDARTRDVLRAQLDGVRRVLAARRRHAGAGVQALRVHDDGYWFVLNARSASANCAIAAPPRTSHRRCAPPPRRSSPRSSSSTARRSPTWRCWRQACGRPRAP